MQIILPQLHVVITTRKLLETQPRIKQTMVNSGKSLLMPINLVLMVEECQSRMRTRAGVIHATRTTHMGLTAVV